MMNQPNQSDVARLRTQIELEHQAMVWALTGLSEGNTQHAYISRRMGHTEIAYKGLSRLIGDEAAISIVSEVWANSPAQSGLTAMAQSQLKLTREDIEQLIAQSQGQPLDLSRRDLSYVNLNNLNLKSANLTEANLTHASLIDANLTYADLSHANCNCAHLSTTNLEEAYLVCTSLVGANLCAANMKGCNLEGTNLQNASLVGARMHGAFISEEAKQALLGRGVLGLDQTISIDHRTGRE